MHILEIPSFLPPLGGEFCLQQARSLTELGHEVRIISCNLLGMKADLHGYLTSRWTDWTEDLHGITCLRTNLHGVPRNIHLNQKHYCKAVLRLYNEYKKRYGKPDILHAHCCLWGGVAAQCIAVRESIPYCITEHLSSCIFDNTFGKGWQHDEWARQLLRETYEQSAAVIPVSHELIADLAPYFGTRYPSRPISNMIDTDFFSYRRRSPHDQRPFKYCCIALADVYRKGLDVLAQAFENIKDAQLYLAGKGTDSPMVKKLFSSCGSVTFMGEINKQQVRELLYQCDALVLPSRSEAQGLVILEALCSGMPVVTTDAIPQNAIHPQGCRIAERGNSDSLCQQMLKVQQTQFQEIWSKEVVDKVSPSVIAQQIESVLKDCYKG